MTLKGLSMRKQFFPTYIGWLVLMALNSAPAGNVLYNYDSAGRLVSADYGAGKSTSYAYDNAGNLLQASQPSPGLQIGTVAGNQFTLSWSAAPGGFTLEASPTVGAGSTWTNANLAATLSGNRLTVTIPVGSGTKFYRLRKP